MALPIRLRLVGRHNISNALAAVAVCEALGVTGDAICRGLDGLSGIPGRVQHAEPPGCPFPVLIDYAHTDDALRNVLGELRAITRGRLICVFGCGGDRDRSKRQRMAAAVEARADVAIVTSDNPRSEDPSAIVEEILSGFGPRPACSVTAEVDRRQAIERAIGSALPGDTVLIAGKGHETYQLIGDHVLDFDDVAIARSCLESAGVRENVA